MRAARGGGYELIAGERRWRAAQRAGLHEVPAVVRDVAPTQAFEMALVENLQREDLNPIEEAAGYERLIAEFGYTQEKLAERVGKERSTVANALRLLRLPDGVRALVAEGRLSMGHARALLGPGDGRRDGAAGAPDGGPGFLGAEGRGSGAARARGRHGRRRQKRGRRRKAGHRPTRAIWGCSCRGRWERGSTSSRRRPGAGKSRFTTIRWTSWTRYSSASWRPDD